MRRRVTSLVATAAAVAVAALGTTQAQATSPAGSPAADGSSDPGRATVIKGTVGPGYTISVSRRHTRPGRYTFKVRDRSDIHDWHIKGPGVNKRTSVSGTGLKTFTVKLTRGTYRIRCDVHTSMRTTLKVP